MSMSPINIIGKQSIAGFSFTGIEGGFGQGKKAMLVKEIADIHGQPISEVNRRINDNRNRFITDVEIIDLKSNGFEPSQFSELGFTNMQVAKANNIYILSERGYAKLLKILEDDKAWELYDQLVDGYFNLRNQLDTTQLSPELQMFQKIFNSVAEQQLEQKRLALKVEQTEKKVDNITEIVSLNTTDWRKDATGIINKIAKKRGGQGAYQDVYNEIYDEVELRGGYQLGIRLSNKRRRLAEEGVSKSKRDKLTKVDVIADDKRLLEIYIAVVKEFAILNNIDI